MLRSSIRRGQICLQTANAFADMDNDFEPGIAPLEMVMILAVPSNQDEMIDVCALQACWCPDLTRVSAMWPEELRLIQPDPPKNCNGLQG